MYQHPGILWFDLETYCEIDLTVVGLHNYVTHPSLGIALLQYAIGDGPVEVWTPGDDAPRDFIDWIALGNRIAAWNAVFDYSVLSQIRPWGVSPRLMQIDDVMAWANAANAPGMLEHAGKWFNLPAKLRKSAGKRLIKKFCAPQKNGQRLYAGDALDQWAEFVHYGRQDIVAMREIARRVPRITDAAYQEWLYTYKLNAKGVPVDRDECLVMDRVIEDEKTHLNTEAVRLANGAFTSVTQKSAVNAWLKSQGVLIEKFNPKGERVQTLAKDEVANYLAKNPHIDLTVKRVLDISLAVNQTSGKKFRSFINLICHDGTIKHSYRWHGAGTGRYASRGGMNLQNLKRPVAAVKKMDDMERFLTLSKIVPTAALRMPYPNLMDCATSAARYVIRAPDGQIFICADYSSVENRVAAWLAKDWAVIKRFNAGIDEYKDLAVEFYRVAYDDVTADQRQVAKPGVLGGQFGQGSRGMIKYAAGLAIDLTKSDAKRLVRAYRSTHAEVASMWYELGDLAVDAVRNPGQEYTCRGRVTLYVEENHLCLRLPSGRVIRWYEPRVTQQTWPPKLTPLGEAQGADLDVDDYLDAGWTLTQLRQCGYVHPAKYRDGVEVKLHEQGGTKQFRAPLIGSSIFQSAVQAIAYDLMAHGLQNLSAHGYDVRMTTHDEAIAIAPPHGSEGEFNKLICQLPAWADGLPIASESWSGKRNRK